MLLQLTNLNLVGGVGLAIFTVIIGTDLKEAGLRNYLLILTVAILTTATVIERWFLDNSFIISCLVGFSIGFIIDDVYMNLKATVPTFVKEILDDVLRIIKRKIKNFLE